MNRNIIKIFFKKNGPGLIFRDIIRYYFKKKKITINSISPWSNRSYNENERSIALESAKKWCEANNSNSFRDPQNNDYHYEMSFTDAFFELFNKKKYIPSEPGNIIDLSFCAKISCAWLIKFEKNGNVQFLNASLKMNDFLIYCQLKVNDPKLKGAIPSWFPVWIDNKSKFDADLLFRTLEYEKKCLDLVKP